MTANCIVGGRSHELWNTRFENTKATSILNFKVQFITSNDDWQNENIFEKAVFNFEMRNIIYVTYRLWSG